MIRQIVLFVAGLACIVSGVSMLSIPAGLIVGGIIIGAVSLLYDFKPIRRGRA